MMPKLDVVARAVQLRQLRVQMAEQVLRRRRLEFDEALAELRSAQLMRDAWEGAAANLEAWVTGSDLPRHRWTEVVDIRRRDFVRGCAEARRYVEWQEDQAVMARDAQEAARQAWTNERSRLDALSKRQASESRRAAARSDEAIFEELADASSASRSRGAR